MSHCLKRKPHKPLDLTYCYLYPPHTLPNKEQSQIFDLSSPVSFVVIVVGTLLLASFFLIPMAWSQSTQTEENTPSSSSRAIWLRLTPHRQTGEHTCAINPIRFRATNLELVLRLYSTKWPHKGVSTARMVCLFETVSDINFIRSKWSTSWYEDKAFSQSKCIMAVLF